jgi:hypothetical protein
MASTPVGKSSDACVLETYPLVFSFDPPLVLNGQWVPPQMYNQWCIFAHNQWCIYIYIIQGYFCYASFLQLRCFFNGSG